MLAQSIHVSNVGTIRYALQSQRVRRHVKSDVFADTRASRGSVHGVTSGRQVTSPTCQRKLTVEARSVQPPPSPIPRTDTGLTENSAETNTRRQRGFDKVEACAP